MGGGGEVTKEYTRGSQIFSLHQKRKSKKFAAEMDGSRDFEKDDVGQPDDGRHGPYGHDDNEGALPGGVQNGQWLADGCGEIKKKGHLLAVGSTGCVSKNLTLYKNARQTKPTFGKWSSLIIFLLQLSLDQTKVLRIEMS